MRIAVVTLFPELVESVAKHGVVGRAFEDGVATLTTVDPRDDTTDVHRTVDDRPYGGGPGMVMKAGPLRAAIGRARDAAGAKAPVIVLSPQGRTLDRAAVERLGRLPGLVLVAGRYEGIDERVIALEADEELSIGDYVLSGGELAAMVVIDALVRRLPGVVGDPGSVGQDSFEDGLLDHPHYTRPETVDGLEVPPTLKSGDHAAIRRWRLKQALGRTWERRPDLADRFDWTPETEALLDEYRRECDAGDERD